jgi:hypothetical protein
MSVYSGPEVASDGLVFAYDMANTEKSFKGAPTFNASLQDGQNNVSPWGGDGTPTSLGIDPNITFRGRKVAKFQTGTSANCYINGAARLATSTNSTVWTSTFYLRRVDGAAISTVGIYLYVTGNANIVTTASATAVEDGWYKVVYTGSGLVSGYPTLTGMYSLGSAVQYYFADWQCENLAISTPWVNGTRSTTQALLNLTNNTTITATSLTYAADNTFSFNGTSSFIDSNPVTLTGTATQSITWACWVQPASGTGDIINMVYPTAGWNMCPIWASGQIFYAKVWNNPNLTSGATFTLNRYYYLVLVRNNATNTNSFYIDGQLVASNIGAYSSSGSDNNHYFGRAGSQATNTFFNGRIPVGQIYTRALSADEILQNFSAVRGRFGI